jgi:hypothetical protein
MRSGPKASLGVSRQHSATFTEATLIQCTANPNGRFVAGPFPEMNEPGKYRFHESLFQLNYKQQ